MTEPPGDRPRRRSPGRPDADPAAGSSGRARARDAGGGGPRGGDRAAAARGGPGKGASAKKPPSTNTPAKGAPAKAGGTGTRRPGSGRAATSEGAKSQTGKGRAAKGPAAKNQAAKSQKAAATAEAAAGPVRGAGGRWPMAERAVLPTVLGIPPLAAVGLAAALTAVGVLVDLTQVGGLGTVFTICHISGCVLAVAWVRRNGLFGPIVQPPLLVALSVPVVVLLAGPPRPGQGVAERLLVIGAPLVNAFPVMAWTTGIVVVLGLLRVLLQRPLNGDLSGRSGRGAAPAAART